MDFKSNKPIYMQIVDYSFHKMLTKEWQADQRIPSVRELAMLLQVNPNTAMRAFEYMQQEDIIYPKRGLGYYVSPQAYKHVLSIRKKEFFDEILPETFALMDELGITFEEISQKYKQSK
jgi:DNA-binding transcriptional regulator YhcF (GntR family)